MDSSLNGGVVFQLRPLVFEILLNPLNFLFRGHLLATQFFYSRAALGSTPSAPKPKPVIIGKVRQTKLAHHPLSGGIGKIQNSRGAGPRFLCPLRRLAGPDALPRTGRAAARSSREQAADSSRLFAAPGTSDCWRARTLLDRASDSVPRFRV